MSKCRRTKKYGILHFLFDFILGCLTGGVWWLFLLFKYMHNR